MFERVLPMCSERVSPMCPVGHSNLSCWNFSLNGNGLLLGREMPTGTGVSIHSAWITSATGRSAARALQRAGGRIYGEGGAAELLGINPTTLASRLRAFKIRSTKLRESQGDCIEG